MKSLGCREWSPVSQNIMEDGVGIYNELSSNDSIQEMRHEQRPARMVGLLSLDSAESSKEAGLGENGRLHGGGGKDGIIS